MSYRRATVTIANGLLMPFLYISKKPITSLLQLYLLSFTFLLCFTTKTLGQSPIPPAAEPGRAPAPAPPPEIPQLQFELGVDIPGGIQAPRATADVSVPFNGVQLEGVTAFSLEELEPLWAGLIGTEISVGELYGIANAIKDRYKEDGYILSFAYLPPQSVSDGIFRIGVVEGYVDSLEVAGPARVASAVENALSPIVGDRPADIRDLERALLLADDLPGATIQGTLRPAEESTGAADLVARVEQKWIDASVSFDNRGSKFSGRYTGTAQVSLNNILGLGERATVTGTLARPIKELRYVTVQYEQPIPGTHINTFVSGEYSTSMPGFTLDELEVKTEGWSYVAGAAYPVVRSRDFNLNVSVAFESGKTYADIRAFEQAGGDPRQTRDRLHGIQFNVDASQVGWMRSATVGTLTFFQGIPGLGASDDDSRYRSRVDGEAGTQFFALDLYHAQRLTHGFSMNLSALGQFSFAGQYSPYEFAVGGSRIGRAYDPGEITGDDGVGVSAELVFEPPAEWLPSWIDPEIYAFYDFGMIWNKPSTEVIQARTGKQTLASAGAGLRVDVADHLSAFIELAEPLTRAQATYGETARKVYFGGKVSY